MKRFLIRLLIFLVIAAGAAWLLYPTISNQLSAGRNDRVMEAYRKAVHALEPEAMQKMLDDAAAWNAELQKEGIPDVFSGGGRKTGAGYQELLNVSGGVIGELEIPGIHVKLPVYHGGSSAADRLIHVAGTDLPADRDGTHTVLAGPGIRKAGGILGNLQLTDARMLEDLEQATQNDLIFLRVLNRTMIFRVTDVKMLSPEGLAGADLSGEEGEQLLTVMTERHGRRLLVQGKRIPAAEAKEAEKAAPVEPAAAIPAPAGTRAAAAKEAVKAAPDLAPALKEAPRQAVRAVPAVEPYQVAGTPQTGVPAVHPEVIPVPDHPHRLTLPQETAGQVTAGLPPAIQRILLQTPPRMGTKRQ